MTTDRDPFQLDQVREVLQAHRAALMAEPHVVGVGIGRPDPEGPYVLVVMTDRGVPAPPLTAADGVPVVWQATGPLRLQGGSSGTAIT